MKSADGSQDRVVRPVPLLAPLLETVERRAVMRRVEMKALGPARVLGARVEFLSPV